MSPRNDVRVYATHRRGPTEGAQICPGAGPTSIAIAGHSDVNEGSTHTRLVQIQSNQFFWYTETEFNVVMTHILGTLLIMVSTGCA